ncbi:HU family DNA-binding protein [Flavobacterium sp.]|uniref:HU family DNA-binding protein n=1 Tax=Flavobacterium sp. TaxID=239 RepID=UPI004047F428
MAIRYRITKRTNTIAATKKEQFIMQAVNTGTVDIRKLSEEISKESSHSIADVMGVIIALGVKMQQHLEDGKIIDLGDVGKFKIGFQGKAADNASELTPKRNIKKFHLNYQPSLIMKRRLKKAITVYKEGSRSLD